MDPTAQRCASFARKAELKGLRVGVLVSGGNVDLQRFCELVA